MTRIGADVVAHVQKNDSKNRPPTKVGRSFAVDVTMVPMMTPKQPRKIGSLRPRQSATQTKNAPAICPIWKMANTIPVDDAPLSVKP